MTSSYAFCVLNPVAGTSQASQVKKAITQQMDKAGWTYTIHETEKDEDVAETVREALSDGYTVAIAAGGDGTVSATANGLVGSDVPLGIVPSGTGNALARDLGIPLKVSKAIALIVGPHRRQPIDALLIDDRYYFLNMSIGVTAAAIEDTARTEKRRLGLLAYLITGIQKLSGLQPASFELVVDDRSRYVRAADIVVTNSSIIGIQTLKLVPDNAIDDGEVNVCIVRGRTLFDYVGALLDTMLRRPRNARIECLTAHEQIEVTSTRPLPVQADGEPIGQQHARVEIVPQAIDLIVPQARAATRRTAVSQGT